MSNFIKSNSCLLAVDSSPAFTTGERLGLYFVDLLQDFEFSVSPPRTQARQIGSQSFGADSINFSPDVLANMSFNTRRDFGIETLLGAVFRPSGIDFPIFSGVRGHSFNAYLFLSDLQSYDLIKQIKDSQSFSGVTAISIGNCYLTELGMNFAVNSIPRNSCSFIASNIVSEVLTGNYMQIPAINLESGTTDGAASIFLNPHQVERLPTGNITGEIVNTWSARFQPSFENLQIPHNQLANFAETAISSLDITVSIDRENAYGFGSDHVYGRDIKYPIQGSISIAGLVSDYQTGSFADLMTNEKKYNIQIYDRDYQDEYLSGLSLTEFTGINETGHIVDNHWLKFENCILREKRDSISVNGLLGFSTQFDFAANEFGGMTFKNGNETSLDKVSSVSSDWHELFSSDGHEIIGDYFLRYYESDCSIATLLSSDKLILLTADNFCYDSEVQECVLPPSLPSGVFALYLSITDGSSGSFVPLGGFPTSGANGGYLQSGVRVFYSYAPTGFVPSISPTSGELFDTTTTGDFPNFYYRLGSHRARYSGGYGLYDITYNFDNEVLLSSPQITGSGYISSFQIRVPFTSGNHHLVEIYKSADGTGSFTGFVSRNCTASFSVPFDTGVVSQSIYYYFPVGIRGGIHSTGLITGYVNPRACPSGLYFDEGSVTFNEEATLRWTTGIKPIGDYSFKVYRNLSGISPPTYLGGTTGMSYKDTTMVDPGVYIFRATTVINGFESPTGTALTASIEAF